MKDGDVNIESLQNLISEFSRITPFIVEPPTLFEVAGYPHFENVISNVLKYFMESDQDHDLSSLFVESLLSAADELNFDEFDTNYESCTVHREFTTQEGKRIDLFVETDNFCITIENKIFAPLSNDLTHYRNFIERKYDIKNICIVLSLQDETVNSNQHKFKNVTYEQFFNELESRMGNVVVSTELKFLLYLADFIKTIRNLNRKTMMTEEFLNFLDKNKDQIEDLHEKAFKEFKKELERKAGEIFDVLSNLMDLNEDKFKLLDYKNKDRLEFAKVCRTKINWKSTQLSLEIKLRLKPSNYAIELWTDNPPKQDLFHKYVKENFGKDFSEFKPNDDKPDRNVIINEDFEYGAAVDEVANELKKLIEKIVVD